MCKVTIFNTNGYSRGILSSLIGAISTDITTIIVIWTFPMNPSLHYTMNNWTWHMVMLMVVHVWSFKLTDIFRHQTFNIIFRCESFFSYKTFYFHFYIFRKKRCGFSMVTACSQFWTYPCAKMLDVGRWFIIWKAPMLLRWFLILTLLLVLGRQLPLMLYNITEEINLYTIPNTLNRSHVLLL